MIAKSSIKSVWILHPSSLMFSVKTGDKSVDSTNQRHLDVLHSHVCVARQRHRRSLRWRPHPCHTLVTCRDKSGRVDSTLDNTVSWKRAVTPGWIWNSILLLTVFYKLFINTAGWFQDSLRQHQQHFQMKTPHPVQLKIPGTNHSTTPAELIDLLDTPLYCPDPWYTTGCRHLKSKGRCQRGRRQGWTTDMWFLRLNWRITHFRWNTHILFTPKQFAKFLCREYEPTPSDHVTQCHVGWKSEGMTSLLLQMIHKLAMKMAMLSSPLRSATSVREPRIATSKNVGNWPARAAFDAEVQVYRHTECHRVIVRV